MVREGGLHMFIGSGSISRAVKSLWGRSTDLGP
jgi:hypothetical protein